MRPLSWLCCAGLLLSGVGCSRESATDRAIREAKERKPDAGVVLPVPENATLLASGQNVPRNLLVDDAHLYWLNEGLRAEGKPGVFTVAKSGGDPQMLWEGKGVDAIALAGDAVFVSIPPEEKVLRIPKAGGKPEVVAEVAGLSALTSDGQNVYWTCEEGIFKLPASGGKPKAVVSGISVPMGLAVDGPNVYWYSAMNGDVSRAPASGGGRPRSFFKQELTLHNYIAHGGELFWSLGSDQKAEVRRISTSGGAPSAIATGLKIPVELAADERDVYWTTGDEVMRAPRSGGGATAVVKGTDRSIGVAVDGSYVYWTDRGGRIQRVAK